MKYLEHKYAIIESVVKGNKFSELEQNSKEKFSRKMKIFRYPLIFINYYTIFLVILFLTFTYSLVRYISLFYYAFAFTIPPIATILLIAYLNYLKKKIGVVLKSLTPYYSRYIKTDEKNFNYILELQPKEVTQQFIHGQVK